MRRLGCGGHFGCTVMEVCIYAVLGGFWCPGVLVCGAGQSGVTKVA